MSDGLLFDVTDWRTWVWQGMPEFECEDRGPYHTLLVHFECEADIQDFERLIGQKVPRGAVKNSIWHPQMEIERYEDKRYVSD